MVFCCNFYYPAKLCSKRSSNTGKTTRQSSVKVHFNFIMDHWMSRISWFFSCHVTRWKSSNRQSFGRTWKPMVILRWPFFTSLEITNVYLIGIASFNDRRSFSRFSKLSERTTYNLALRPNDSDLTSNWLRVLVRSFFLSWRWRLLRVSSCLATLEE